MRDLGGGGVRLGGDGEGVKLARGGSRGVSGGENVEEGGLTGEEVN